MTTSLLGALVALSVAQPPPSITIQARVTNLAGQAVDGTYDFAVRLYDQEVGGNQLHQTLLLDTTVTDGVFAAVLTGVDVASLIGQPEVWVGVQVESEPELPRRRVHSVPFALLAARLECSGCVTSIHLGMDSVGPSELAPLAVEEGHVADGAITEDKLGPGAVTGLKIAGDAITSAHILNGEVKTGDIEAGAVNASKLGLTLVTGTYCDHVSAALIPDSTGAVFCALSRVDDDTAGGWCSVFKSGANWMMQTGGGCGANACTYICLK